MAEVNSPDRVINEPKLKTMRLKVVARNHGRREDVGVFNAETGEMLLGVQKVTYEASVEKHAKCVIEVIGVEVDLEVDAEVRPAQEAG